MTYSNEIINLCIQHYNNNINVPKTSLMTNVSSITIYRWIDKYNYYFINNTPLTEKIFEEIKKSKIHRASKIHIYEKDICQYVESNNGCSLNDILENIPDAKLSKSTICNLLKKNNISHKKINNRIIEKDLEKINEERILFSNSISDNEFLETIAIDETSKCVTDHKRYGYSEKGVEIKKMFKHKKNRERRTLLAAVTKEGFVDKKIINGSVNGEIYLDFFKENIQTFKNKNILHDNARIHHYKILKEFCKNNDIRLIYTPAYSPEFNPIELVFSEIKTNFRKLKHENLEEDINTSINNVNTDNFIKYYNHSLKFFDKYRN